MFIMNILFSARTKLWRLSSRCSGRENLLHVPMSPGIKDLHEDNGAEINRFRRIWSFVSRDPRVSDSGVLPSHIRSVLTRLRRGKLLKRSTRAVRKIIIGSCTITQESYPTSTMERLQLLGYRAGSTSKPYWVFSLIAIFSRTRSHIAETMTKSPPNAKSWTRKNDIN